MLSVSVRYSGMERLRSWGGKYGYCKVRGGKSYVPRDSAMRPLLVVLIAACVGSGCVWHQLFTRPAAPTPEERLDELVRTIDDNSDSLHSELTPSVNKLIEIG